MIGSTRLRCKCVSNDKDACNCMNEQWISYDEQRLQKDNPFDEHEVGARACA